MTNTANAGTARAAAADRHKKWAVALLFAAMFLPGAMSVGINLPPYRLLLMVLAVPFMLQFRNDPTLRITSVDVFVFLAIFWRSLAIVVNHQTEQLLNAISSFIDLFFAYMLGRVCVRSVEDFRYFFKCFLVFMVCLSPFIFFEFFAFFRPLREIAQVLGFTVQAYDVEGAIRLGFLRAAGPFEHPLLFGTFCLTAVSNLYYIHLRDFPRNLIASGFAAVLTLMAISSSSILGLALQISMIVYDRTLRVFRSRWILAVGGALAFWFLFQMIAGRTFFSYVIHDLTLRPGTGEGRMEIFTYGMKNVFMHPIFGIGLNDWVRPFWRNNPSMDNNWLFFAMRYGLPAFFFLTIAYVLQLVRLFRTRSADWELMNLRTGYTIALIVQVLLLATHATWGAANAYVMVYLGVGVWIWEAARREAEDARLARRRARTATSARARDHHSASA